MKEVKIIAIAVIITIAILFSCAYAIPAHAEQDRGEFYPRLTVVIEKEQTEEPGWWVVICRDKDGNLWTFYDDEEEWNVGDIANFLMWNTSEHEEDDKIIEVYWEGYTEDIYSFFQMEGWR